MHCLVLLVVAFASFVNGLKQESPRAIPLNFTTSLNGTGESWKLFKQCDSRWAPNRLGTCSETICQAGCAMSCVAMILATKGVNIDPGVLNSWLRSHGGYVSGCDIIWSKANEFGKVAFIGQSRQPYAAICDGISKGYAYIANVMNGRHWVLLSACEANESFEVNDPGFSRSSYTYGEVGLVSIYN